MSRFRDDGDELVEVEADLIHETDKAYLIDNGSVKVWVPKRFTTFDGFDVFEMPRWLAHKEGLI